MAANKKTTGKSETGKRKPKKTPVSGVIVKSETGKKKPSKREAAAAAAAEPGSKPALPIVRFKHKSGIRKDNELTRGMELANSIDLDVETGRATTANGLAERWPNCAQLARRIGWAINDGRWTISGVTPNNLGQKKNRKLNTALGADVLANHGKKTIVCSTAKLRRSVTM